MPSAFREMPIWTAVLSFVISWPQFKKLHNKFVLESVSVSVSLQPKLCSPGQKMKTTHSKKSPFVP